MQKMFSIHKIICFRYFCTLNDISSTPPQVIYNAKYNMLYNILYVLLDTYTHFNNVAGHNNIHAFKHNILGICALP